MIGPQGCSALGWGPVAWRNHRAPEYSCFMFWTTNECAPWVKSPSQRTSLVEMKIAFFVSVKQFFLVCLVFSVCLVLSLRWLLQQQEMVKKGLSCSDPHLWVLSIRLISHKGSYVPCPGYFSCCDKKRAGIFVPGYNTEERTWKEWALPLANSPELLLVWSKTISLFPISLFSISVPKDCSEMKMWSSPRAHQGNGKETRNRSYWIKDCNYDRRYKGQVWHG